MFSSLTTFTLLALSLSFAANADAHRGPNRRHQDIAKRGRSDILPRAFGNSKWSFYDAGMGACGKPNTGSDFIVALNSPQFGGGYPGPNCFKTITMNFNGKSAQATVMDECPGCPFGGLDLTRGLFNHFASEDKGIIYGSWFFNEDGGGEEPAPTPKPTPKTTYTPPPPPATTKKTSTSKWIEPTPDPTPEPTPEPITSSTKKTSSTTSSSTWSEAASTSSVASSSSVAPSSTVNSILAVPSGTVEGISNLNELSQIVVGIAGMVLAGEQV